MTSVNFINTNEVIEKISILFESEKKKLLEQLPNAAIEHVGGTSIPDLISQGDLDINIRVQSDEFEETKIILTKLYKAHRPDTWPSGFASFKDELQNIDIELTVVGSRQDFFVVQREYLKRHPDAVSKLNALKEQFRGKSKSEYGDAKGKYFENLASQIHSST